MRENKTIYVVTKGAYSDYHIIGVYDDEGMAERIAALHNDARHPQYSTTDVEEWTLNDPSTNEYPDDYLPYCVTIYDSGRGTIERESLPINERRLTAQYVEQDSTGRTLAALMGRDQSNYWCVYVWARDEDHAKKIGCDKIAQAMAEKAGIA